jgi:hypothetical protein
MEISGSSFKSQAVSQQQGALQESSRSRGSGAAPVARHTSAGRSVARPSKPAAAPAPAAPGAENEYTRVVRAKEWSEEVELLFRLQSQGWSSLSEYVSVYGAPPVSHENGFYRVVRVKSNGNWTYWRKERECSQKDLNSVKIYM